MQSYLQKQHVTNWANTSEHYLPPHATHLTTFFATYQRYKITSAMQAWTNGTKGI